VASKITLSGFSGRSQTAPKICDSGYLWQAHNKLDKDLRLTTATAEIIANSTVAIVFGSS
jgi:hypothetical protein